MTRERNTTARKFNWYVKIKSMHTEELEKTVGSEII